MSLTQLIKNSNSEGLELTKTEYLAALYREEKGKDGKPNEEKGNPIHLIECLMTDEKGVRLNLEEIHREWHDFILDRIYHGYNRIGILAPWGTGKTLNVAIGFILHMLIENQNLRIKIVCNTDTNAKARVSTLERYIELSMEWDFLAEGKVRHDENEKWTDHEFFLERDSMSIDPTVQARGITTGGISGRADVIVFDDPVDYQLSVQSQATRRKCSRLAKEVWMSRLPRGGKGGLVIAIATTWHEEDIIHEWLQAPGWSWLIQRASEYNDHIEQIDYTVEPGTEKIENQIVDKLFERHEDNVVKIPLPFGLTKEDLDIMELQDMDMIAFHRGWKQRAFTQGKDSFFALEDFEYIDEDDLPAMGVDVRYWDMAGTEKTDYNDPSYTAGLRVAMDRGYNVYIRDSVRRQKDPEGVETLVRRTANRDGKRIRIYIEQEPGSSGKVVISHYTKNVLPEFYVKGDLPSGSKETRATPVSSAGKKGKLFIVRGTWNKDFTDEATLYPFGKKDQIDALSGAYGIIVREFLGGKIPRAHMAITSDVKEDEEEETE